MKLDCIVSEAAKLKRVDRRNQPRILLTMLALGASVFATMTGVLAMIAGLIRPAASCAVPVLAGLGFVFAGITLILLCQRLSGDNDRKVSLVGAITLTSLALLTLGECLVQHSKSAIATPFQIPLCLLIMSTGIYCVTSNRPKLQVVAQICALSVGFYSSLALIGFAFDFSILTGAVASGVSFPCLLVILALSTALFLVRPTQPPASILISDTLGGVVARRLLPICFLPPVLGLIGRLQGSQSSPLLILILIVILGLPVLIYLVARALDHAQNEKDQAYSQVQVLNQQLNKQVDELVKSQSQITEALRARSEFLAKVSHELRTPLSGIIGTTELLVGMPLSSEQRELANIALDSANSLLALINEILDFSKIDARKLQIEYINFDLMQVVETAVQSMRAKANKKHLSLLTFIAPDVPTKVKGDPGRLRQIMVNLIDNAIKFTEQGKVLVQVAVEADNPNHVRFSITDSGIGISTEQSERLFQPFVQADGSTTRRYGGTGLGLSICKSLADLMHGKIGIISSPGKGSTFWFILPLEAVSADEEESDSYEQQKITCSAKASKLLLVEDNPVNSRLAVLQLKRLGYEADTASTGREAVEAFEKKHYAMILMDIQMPDMDGFEATSIIRQKESGTGMHVPIVATTAHAMLGDREKCLAGGMDDYLTKPLALESLSTVIKRWCTRDPMQTFQLPPELKKESIYRDVLPFPKRKTGST